MSTAPRQRRANPNAAPETADKDPSPHVFEGDYRPSADESSQPSTNIRVDPVHQVEFLHSLVDALNTTLDLNTLMHRVADLVRAVIDYRIFAILLLNDRTQELWMRFQIGHTPEVERTRIKIGSGIIGQAALQRRSILVPDTSENEHYISANPNVRSELAVPLIVKNRVIGVLDLESELPAFFDGENVRMAQ